MKAAAPNPFCSNMRPREPEDSFSAELDAARSQYLKAELKFRDTLDDVCDRQPRDWGFVLTRAAASRNRAFDRYKTKLERFEANGPELALLKRR